MEGFWQRDSVRDCANVLAFSRAGPVSESPRHRRSPAALSKTLPRLFWRVRRGGPADLEIWSQDAFKNGAGTASSPRLVSSTEFYGDEPSPPAVPAPARSLS